MNRDKEQVIWWVCDERVPEAEWQVCAAGWDDTCWLHLTTAYTPACDTIEYAMADNQDPSATSACACDRFDIIRCRADAPLFINNDNWKWGRHNTLFAAYNQQWMMDMVNFYSSGEGFSGYVAAGGSPMTQAEICALDQAFAAAMSAGVAGAEYGANDFRHAFLDQVVNHISLAHIYLAEKLQGIISAAQNDGRLDELNWLMDTVTDLSGGYQWDWNGQAADGEGHGSAQMNELLNLMNGMRNGGNWNVLGAAITPDGAVLDPAFGITEWNDGTGGEWDAFSSADYDAWIESLNQNIMGADWVAANTGANSKYQENFDQWWGWRPAPPTFPPGPTTTIEVWTAIGTPECGPNEHWVECDYCTEHDCQSGMMCAKTGMELTCLIANKCVCDPGYARYTGAHYMIESKDLTKYCYSINLYGSIKT